MSADGIGWVYRHSPYKGAPFAVHLALGDSANDLHDNELYARQGWIAAKARCDRGTVNKALAALLEDGFLELLEDNSTAGKPNRYRLITEGHPVAWDPKRGVVSRHTPCDEIPQGGVASDDTGVCRERAQNPRGNPRENPTGSTPSSTGVDARAIDDEQFDFFWTAYPKRNGKKLGKPVARRAFLRLSIADRRAAFRGAVNYAQASGAGMAGAMDAERFLKHRRWEDWQTPAAPDAQRVNGGKPTLEQRMQRRHDMIQRARGEVSE